MIVKQHGNTAMASNGASRRLRKELQSLLKEPEHGMWVAPRENNVLQVSNHLLLFMHLSCRVAGGWWLVLSDGQMAACPCRFNTTERTTTAQAATATATTTATTTTAATTTIAVPVTTVKYRRRRRNHRHDNHRRHQPLAPPPRLPLTQHHPLYLYLYSRARRDVM